MAYVQLTFRTFQVDVPTMSFVGGISTQDASGK